MLASLEKPADGHSAVFSLLSQKGDLCLMHWRRTLEELRQAELAWTQSRVRSFLVPSYSYLAVIELGGYELSQHAAAMVARAGTKPGDAGYDAGEVMEVGAGELTIYDNLDADSGKVCWSDLCRGPHLPNTRLIGAFRLMRSAAAAKVPFPARIVPRRSTTMGFCCPKRASDPLIASRFRSS